MDSFIVSPQNSYGDTLTPTGVVLGGETSGLYLSFDEVMGVGSHDGILYRDKSVLREIRALCSLSHVRAQLEGS